MRTFLHRNHAILSGCARCTKRFNSSETLTSPSPPTSATTATTTPATSHQLITDDDRKILNFPYELVDRPSQLSRVVEALQAAKFFAVDLEANVTSRTDTKQLGSLSLLQLCALNEPTVFLVDVQSLTPAAVSQQLGVVLADESKRKLFFDCRRDVEALSCQMNIFPKSVLDLQLLFTGVQWKLRSITRRSGMSFALKQVTGLSRVEGDAAVQLAMTKGNRPVWDVRPLPPHFLEYAAGDVRHTLLLGSVMQRMYEDKVDAAARLTNEYVRHYATGRPVVVEADPTATDVSVSWLERYFGPGGVCSFCGQKGHTVTECFRKQSGSTVCSHCGESGHLARNCFKRHPQLLKCNSCGQLGHTEDRCFRKNPCAHCGGSHRSENCHRKTT